MSENQLSTPKLIEYLKQVAALEASVYNQERTIDATRANFTENQPQLQEPPLYLKEMPDEPTMSKNYLSVSGKLFLWCAGLLFFGISVIVGGSAGSEIGVGVVGIVLTVIGAILGIIFICQVVKSVKKDNQINADYVKAYREYEQRKKEVEETNARLSEQQRDAHNKALIDLSTRKQAFSTNQNNTLTPMTRTLSETKECLAKLYDKDIIFGKYRNMVAMTSIYEYFASGRVSELTGPTGAYNLYESELRQNLVVSELQKINSNLEEIKANQYILYSEIKKGNETQRQILGEVASISRSAVEIKNMAAITAYCAQITAMNEQAQTAMLLL